MLAQMSSSGYFSWRTDAHKRAVIGNRSDGTWRWSMQDEVGAVKGMGEWPPEGLPTTAHMRSALPIHARYCALSSTAWSSKHSTAPHRCALP